VCSDGPASFAASWTASPGKQTLVAGSTSVHRADIASIDEAIMAGRCGVIRWF
jgi:hypothetical protein